MIFNDALAEDHIGALPVEKVKVRRLEMQFKRRAIVIDFVEKNPVVLGIFPVAAYNGGPRNVAKLYRVLTKMDVQLDELSRAPAQANDSAVKCPCVWKVAGTAAIPVAIPRYNNENRWYIEKYQSIVSLFE